MFWWEERWNGAIKNKLLVIYTIQRNTSYVSRQHLIFSKKGENDRLIPDGVFVELAKEIKLAFKKDRDLDLTTFADRIPSVWKGTGEGIFPMGRDNILKYWKGLKPLPGYSKDQL